MATAINFQSASNFNRRGECIIYAYFLCTHAIIITCLSHFPHASCMSCREASCYFLHSQHATLILVLCTDAAKSAARSRMLWTCALAYSTSLHFLHQFLHCTAEFECLHHHGSGWFCCTRSRIAWIQLPPVFLWILFLAKLNGNTSDFG